MNIGSQCGILKLQLLREMEQSRGQGEEGKSKERRGKRKREERGEREKGTIKVQLFLA